MMEERDFSRARQELLRKEDEAHGAIREMLRKFDEKKSGAQVIEDNEWVTKEKGLPPVPRKRENVNVTGSEVRRNRRMAKFVEDLPEQNWEMLDSASEEKADWRLSRMGPKVIAYEPAPWEEDEPMQQDPLAMERDSSQTLEDILEDNEEEMPYPISANNKVNILTPPADYSPPQFPGSSFTIHKLPADIFPAPPSPRSPLTPLSPVSDLAIPCTPTKSSSPSTLRSRAGLKKIFLSTLRPRRKEEIEPPSPSSTISYSSSLTTPTLPTPTIRITSPFHPRRFDGSPIYGDEVPMEKTSPVEMGYRLPELRLSRADWGEWGRQVADRI